MQIQQQKYTKRAQLVCNNGMGQYLNYRQLIREPKHKEIWSTSATNKFEYLVQEVGGRIATKKANPMETTRATIKQLLDYCAMQDKAVLAYKASKMILAVHSDAGNCNEKKSRSQAGGHFFLSNNNEFPPNNSAILTVATIFEAVISLAAEAELGALYLNAKEVAYLQQILAKMGHPQPRTPIQTNNSTAEGVINRKIQPRQTKAMDMCFHWLRDHEAQGQFQIYRQPGKLNSADYFIKHHSPLHHVNVRYEFLSKVKELTEARSQRLTQGQTPPKTATSRLATRVC
jgi:hypothetical protein